MNNCRKCGQIIESNIDICPKCGEKLESVVQENNGVYNIKNPFLEFQSTTSFNNNQGNNQSTNQEFGILNNTNKVAEAQTPAFSSFASTNIIASNNQIQKQQEEKSDILINKDSRKDETNIATDGFLVFSNNHDTTSKISQEEAKENLERLKKLNNPVLDFDPQKIKEEKEKCEKEIELKKEEKNKSSKYMSFIYIILAAIMLFLTIIPLIYDLQIITLIHHLVIVVLLVASYKLAPINKKISSLIGILTSIVMILTILEKDYVTLSLGVALLLLEGFSYFVKDKKLKS